MLEVVLQKCAPYTRRKHHFENRCDPKHEFERESWGLQLPLSMQINKNGNDIYKNRCVVHAAVFADGAREAKNAQVTSHNLKFFDVN